MITSTEWEIGRYRLSPELLKKARELEAKSAEVHKGFRSQRRFTQGYDFVGAVGELLVERWFQMVGEQAEWTGYIREDIHRDEWDFHWRGYSIDVKTQRARYEYNIADYEVRVSDPEPGKGVQAKKPMDIYVFVQYQSEKEVGAILGWVRRDDFFTLPSYRYVAKGEVLFSTKNGDVPAGQPCHVVKVKDLNPMLSLAASLPDKALAV